MKRKARAIDWYALADREAQQVLRALPPDLRAGVAGLVITLDPRPAPDEEQEAGDDEALLGLFCGPAYADPDDGGEPLPAAVRLFVENLRDEAGDDPARFRREVRTTLLHELGHFLGLDEAALAQRDLA
jgi:predicted Zn-dependent protease with MMP-like domain